MAKDPVCGMEVNERKAADSNGDTGVGPNRGSTTSTPRWVKVFGIIALVVVVLFVILMFTRGPGGHGPGRHTPSGGPGGQASPFSVVEHGVQQP